MRRWRRGADLVERLRPYADSSPALERMVSADPIRMFLYRWMIETGDPIEVVAKGFDLDPVLVADLVAGRRRRLGLEEAERVRARLRLDG